MFAVVKIASSKNPFVVSERSQAYNFRTQEVKVSQIMKFLYKSKNRVIEWSACDKTGECNQRKRSGTN